MKPGASAGLAALGRRLAPALALADWLSLRAVWAGGTLLFAAAIVVSVDVGIRKVLRMSVGGADELSGYAFAIGVAWALPFALLRRANVRIDALYQYMPARLCAALDIAALLALAAFATVLARFAWEVLATSWALGAMSNSQLKMPLWIPQGLWFGGLALFCLTTALLTLRATLALAGGDLAAVQALAGARTIVEEAGDEAEYGRSLLPEAKPAAPAR